MSEDKARSLAPAEIEYQFRAIRTDLSGIANRLRSLRQNFDSPVISADLAEAAEALEVMQKKIFAAQTAALKKVFPHRGNAGEHEHW